ncbi:hypothetical protein PG991_001905 [Apiospora marii]|uniref:MARVEL domain-containing protein n=1 Tax=Apiospora marii TaxID=335849 RepID=A0ABR1SNG3_9PEZI
MLSVVALGLRAAMASLPFEPRLIVWAILLILDSSLYAVQWCSACFSSFAGGLALIACLIGVAGLWVTSIPDLVTMALDGVSAVIYLVAGIILTKALKSVSSCTSEDATSRADNRITNFGCQVNDLEHDARCQDLYRDSKDPSMARCQRAVTDYSFEYIGFILCVAMVFLGYVLARRGGSTPTVAAQV